MYYVFIDAVQKTARGEEEANLIDQFIVKMTGVQLQRLEIYYQKVVQASSRKEGIEPPLPYL
jgi:hypothetical protein